MYVHDNVHLVQIFIEFCSGGAVDDIIVGESSSMLLTLVNVNSVDQISSTHACTPLTFTCVHTHTHLQNLIMVSQSPKSNA